MDYKAKLELVGLKLKLITNSKEYFQKMQKAFTRKKKGYYWIPSYRSGQWDGNIQMLTSAGYIPYGLLPEFLKFHRKLFDGKVQLHIDDEVKKIYKADSFQPKFDLSLYPRPYQKEAIEICLKYRNGLIRSATASGKSLIIAYIIKNILDNRKITKARRALIIVPSTSLVEQFYSDMVEYGINSDFIGRVYATTKEWDKATVISTWQSLANNHDKLKLYDIIIADECHQVKSHELKQIMSKAKIARYRFGFTGTLYDDIVENWNVSAFIGPVLKEYPSGFLAEQGYVSKCNVSVFHINYTSVNDEIKYYPEVRKEAFFKNFRLTFLSELVKFTDHNVLLLVSTIEEGSMLKQFLSRSTDKEVEFLRGKDKVAVREEWRKRMMTESNIALIATYGIFQQGINIPNLKYAILASPSKSKIRVLQSVGRALRKHENKEEGAYIFDIIDEVRHLGKHGDIRLSYYEREGFEVYEHKLYEGIRYNIHDFFDWFEKEMKL